MANLTDADKVIRNDVGKSIASKLDDITDAIVAQGSSTIGDLSALTTTNKSSLVGAVNEILTPQTITPTFNTQQTNYSIPYNNTSVVKMGKIVMCMVNPRCLSPYGSYPGALVYSGLPKPVDRLNHFYTFNDWQGKQYEPIRFMLSVDGELYLRNAQVNSEYDGSFVYISE